MINSKAALAIEHRKNRFELLEAQSKEIRDRSGAWTPAQVLEHILLTEKSIIALLSRLKVKAKSPEVRESGKPWPIRAELLTDFGPGAMEVPAFNGTEPAGSMSPDDLREFSKLNTAALQDLMDFADAHEVSDVSFPHPYVGRMNFYEWLVFSAVHERLHIDSLKADLL